MDEDLTITHFKCILETISINLGIIYMCECKIARTFIKASNNSFYMTINLFKPNKKTTQITHKIKLE
jgi:hypothetical protein